MSYEKLATIAKLLYERTESDTIKWVETEKKDVFQTSFPHSSVRIEEVQNKHNDDETDIRITVINDEGSVVEQFTDEDITDLLPKAYQKMGLTLNKARRSALGVDTALDEIIEGLTENSFLDDDLPF